MLLAFTNPAGSTLHVSSTASLIDRVHNNLFKKKLFQTYLFSHCINFSLDFIQLITFSAGFIAGIYGGIVSSLSPDLDIKSDTSLQTFTDALSQMNTNLFFESFVFLLRHSHTFSKKLIVHCPVVTPFTPITP